MRKPADSEAHAAGSAGQAGAAQEAPGHGCSRMQAWASCWGLSGLILSRRGPAVDRLRRLLAVHAAFRGHDGGLRHRHADAARQAVRGACCCCWPAWWRSAPGPISQAAAPRVLATAGGGRARAQRGELQHALGQRGCRPRCAAEIERLDADIVTLIEMSPAKRRILAALKSPLPATRPTAFELDYCKLVDPVEAADRRERGARPVGRAALHPREARAGGGRAHASSACTPSAFPIRARSSAR